MKNNDESGNLPIIFKAIKLPRKISYNNSYWITRGNKKFFFKYAKHKKEKNDNGFIIGELFVNELCKKLGVPCVDYHYAVNKVGRFEQRGVLSPSFLREHEKSITARKIKEQEIYSKFPKEMFLKIKLVYAALEPLLMYYEHGNIYFINHMLTALLDKNHPKQKRLPALFKNFITDNKSQLEELRIATEKEAFITTDEYIRRLTDFAKANGFKIEGNMRLDLQRMAIVDIITKQHDRHDGNVSLIYDEKKKTARLAPMYDNGLAGPFFAEKANFIYPDETLCYIKLTPNDLMSIADGNTQIGQFYQKVKSITKPELIKMGNFIQSLCVDDNLKRTGAATKRYGELYEREKDVEIWKEVYSNYTNGIKYLDKLIKANARENDLEK
ncbi:MAG: hypothetical protein IKQ31_00545 [Clostridia bacterium]|nr:hypothetical protein [Clostridia bacterium]